MTGFKAKQPVIVAMLALAGMLLAGCGSNVNKTKEAYTAVEALDYNTALSLFDEAESEGENIRLINRGRGIAYLGLTKYDDAVSCFESVLKSGNGFVTGFDVDTAFYMATAYMKDKQYDKAAEVYNAIADIKSDSADALLLRGTAMLARGDYTSAKADFDTVINMDKRNYDRIIDICQILDYYGYGSPANEYLHAAMDADNGSMQAYDKGRIYYYLGDYQQAALLFEQNRDKGGAANAIYLGKAYEAIGEYNYATNVYSSYLAKSGDDAAVYNQLGLCNMLKNDYEAALAAFQSGMAIENSGLTQTLMYNEIVAYEYLGDFDKAKVLMRTYISSYPDDETAKRENDFLSTR